MTVLFLDPIFKDKIWGGNKIKESFGYNLSSNTIGECWGISAHESGDCIVSNGAFKGCSLSYIWENYRYLFGNNKGCKFPLMTKIIDSNDNLSIQVHPNNDFAKVNENGELGKTECWYIIDADNDSKIILGHRAKSKEELQNKIQNKQWNKILNIIDIKKGDFFYVPSGTIHALCKGALVLEVQQNSDTTYRLYDYDRVDSDGNSRDLHIDKSLSVIDIPDIRREKHFSHYKNQDFSCTTFISNEFFTVHKLKINKKSNFTHSKAFTLYNILNGSGKLFVDGNIYNISKGSNFILLNDVSTFSLDGNLELIVSHI